jgi:hypothetical protein
LIDIGLPSKVDLATEKQTRRIKMSINKLYDSWSRKISQLLPQLRITQHRNLVWLLVGIYLSHSVHLSKIAGQIPGAALQLSATRRLSRFLASSVIQVRHWYRPIAQQWLQAQAQTTGEIRLVVDGTKIGASHQLLMVAMAFRRRALPIGWTWVRHTRGHSTARHQLALLAYVRSLLPAGVPMLVVGDSEFGAVEVLRALDRWGWHYVLRQKGKNHVQLPGQTQWQPFSSVIQRTGQSLWWAGGMLTAAFAYPVNLLAIWPPGEDEPWLLSTNLPSRRQALQAYRRRMWIEEMFGDLKDNGFDLESTHLRSFLRLSRLTLAVALLYAWLITRGVQVVKAGRRRLVDRADRRDLSIFQIGWRFINRRLVNEKHVSVVLFPASHIKLSGS